MPVASVDRQRAPLLAGERSMLEGWLDFHRATLLNKCSGLDDAQLKLRSAPPSTLSLLGLVRHMTDVERGWFRRRAAGETVPRVYPREDQHDVAFDALDDADVDVCVALYREEIERCRAAAAAVSLDTVVNDRSVRWIYLHMVEEYARHNGHADILRERIDGSTGA